jgi:hypothetical protein
MNREYRVVRSDGTQAASGEVFPTLSAALSFAKWGSTVQYREVGSWVDVTGTSVARFNAGVKE